MQKLPYIKNHHTHQKSLTPVFNHGNTQSFFKPIIQPKLIINQPNDIYEQEADAVAEKVMRMPANKKENTFFKPVNISSIQRKCAHCEEEEKLQMKGEPGATGGMTAPAVAHEVINSPGQKLDAGTRGFMESRFGYDFGNVQIHNDSLAHQSSTEINALAYTHGNHVVFGAGQYQPNTKTGKQLLAHELTHVVQQGKNSLVQRQVATTTPTKTTSSGKNIIVSLDNDTETKIQSKIRIKGAQEIRAYSLKDFVSKLGKVSGNIDNLIIYSHGSGVGAVKFVDKAGAETWVDIADLAKALSGKIKLQVNNIEFEGCSLGNVSSELKSFGKAMNAAGVKAHSCNTFSRILKGITINKKNVKKRSDIRKGDEALFQKTLLDQAKKKLVTANGISVTDCVEGITQGQTLNIKEAEDVFFANNGVISAEWDSPVFNNNWQPGSICKRDVTPTTSPCKLIEVTP